MAAKQFVPVSFNSKQLIDQDTLNQINNNMVWLRDRSVTGNWLPPDGGGVINTGIKFQAGTVTLPKDKNEQVGKDVHFAANIFTPGTNPIVTATVVCSWSNKITPTVSGIGQNRPDDRGFHVVVKAYGATNKKDNIAKPVFVNWIAVGV